MPRRRPSRRLVLLAAAMMAPFLLLAAFVMVAPAGMLVVQSIHGPDGFTLDPIARLAGATYRLAAWNSILLSLASAFVALVLGTTMALIASRADSRLGTVMTSFSAVAAQFGGVPLAFAFVSTLGMFGLVTRGLKVIGADIYAMGFSLYSVAGLTLVYTYFLAPLAVVILTPAIRGVRADWLLAATSLGASPGQRFRLVVLPILAPALVSCFTLLFGSAFSGYATAYALTSGNIVLLTTEIGNVLTGDVVSSPETGAALSIAMIAVMALLLGLGSRMRRLSRRGRG
ncbi:ABC transporter permease [Kaistia algarum]|uniref:ABC transporter permease n=1 Tax=Kaistia algarum TaxID=2083279 RepID=UPI002253C8F0|nr:ABC transporter permease subunit [Kaistia algarum]MCX5512812.1 ABC transporter permease subunit [Kaistia algarum]